MRKLLTTLITTLCLSAAISQPALARDNHHRDNDRHHGWHDNGRHNGHGWRDNRRHWNRVVYRPAPVVRYYAPAYYYEPYYDPYPYTSTSLSFFFR